MKMFNHKSLFKNSQVKNKPVVLPENKNELIRGTVLLLNIDHNDLFLIRNLLSSMGCKVVPIDSLDDLRSELRQIQPAGIISDCSGNPAQATVQYQRLRLDSTFSQTPIIFLLDPENDTIPDLGKNASHYEYLLKPVDSGKLRNRIDSMIQNRSWRQIIPPRSSKGLFQAAPLPASDKVKLPTSSTFDINTPSTLDSPMPETVHNEVLEPKPPVLENAESLSKPKEASESSTTEPITQTINQRYSLYDKAVAVVAEQADKIRLDQPISLRPLLELSRLINAEIPQSSDLEVRALNKREVTSLPNRIVNMTIFAIQIGLRMHLTEAEMLKIGYAALVHDLGMIRVPREILSKEHQLTDKEYAVIKKHPIYAKDLVLSAEDYDPSRDNGLIKAISEVHEREDGLGYPLGLKADQIDLTAKVLAVAGRFEAMSHPRTYRKSFVAHVAMQEIVKLKDQEFSARVIKALVIALSIFPLYSYVGLNNNQIGRVIGINRTHPLRPVLEIVIDENGKKIDPPTQLNLKEFPFLYVAKTLLPEEVE